MGQSLNQVRLDEIITNGTDYGKVNVIGKFRNELHLNDVKDILFNFFRPKFIPTKKHYKINEYDFVRIYLFLKTKKEFFNNGISYFELWEKLHDTDIEDLFYIYFKFLKSGKTIPELAELSKELEQLIK